MKHVVCLSFFLFLSASLFSQKQDVEKKITHFHWHELQFAFGDPFYSSMLNYFYYDPYYANTQYWFSEDTYTKWWAKTPAITALYRYRFRKWFWMEGMLSYQGSYFQNNNLITDERISISQQHCITIMPAVRFSWLNKKIVTLYSGVAFGATFLFHVNDPWSNSKLNFKLRPALQFTAIGVEVGKKWFGFAELGYGNKGIVAAGFGFRFYSKND